MNFSNENKKSSRNELNFSNLSQKKIQNIEKIKIIQQDQLNKEIIEKNRNIKEEKLLLKMDSPRISKKKNGVVKSYAVNTSNGLVRNYNEDRVAIILNVDKPKYLKEEDNWPKISFFGIYDGHGGVNCADFLKDNLHKFVIIIKLIE